MALLNIGNATTTDFNSQLADYSVNPKSTDRATNDKFYWTYTKASQQQGYYKTIPELKKAIDSLPQWVIGRGYTTDETTRVMLEHIVGNGKETFDEILASLIINKLVYGCAFAQIIRDEDTDEIINIKVLDTANMQVAYNKKGMITGYRYSNVAGIQTDYETSEILHLINDKHSDEVHGTSVIDACENIILARNEAMSDWRKVLHRNLVPLKIMEVDTDVPSEIDSITSKLQTTIKSFEWLVVPKGTVGVTIPNIPLTDPIAWIQYLEQQFYFAVGVPRSVLGGSDTFTESTAKAGFISYEQVYTRHQKEIEGALWNQLYIKIKFNRPPSLLETEQINEAKNTGQVGLQSNEVSMMAGEGLANGRRT